MGFTFAPEYGYTMLAAIIMGFECLLIGFFIPGRARGQTFTEEFMKENFGEIHRQAFNEQIKAQGYPDMGSGVYSMKLPYEKWYSFNNAQRAHQNFLEFLPASLVFLLAAGFFFPITSAIIGLVMIIARIIYSCGYYMGGPNGRIVGALVNDLAILGIFGLSIASAIMLIIGKQKAIA